MRRALFAYFSLMITLADAGLARAESFRCSDLPYLSPENSPANNQWGKVCHAFDYLGGATDAFIGGLDNDPNGRKFAVYRTGSTLITSPWPLAPAPAPQTTTCPGGVVFVSVCPAGCYAPDQKLLVDGAYMSIESAYQSQAPTVTSLTSSSDLGNLSFAEQPIQSYVVGETNESLYRIEADNGKQLRVTEGHPLVNAEGTVVPAKSLKAGDELLCADGETATVSKVSIEPYSGWVMSVEPRSRDKRENIHVANGFLAGSVRFQAQWASDDTRLIHRDLFDLTDL